MDFNEILRDYSLPNATYTDDSFSWPYAIRWPDLAASNLTDLSHWVESNTSWIRISEEFSADSFSLWGTNGIQPQDAIQGQIGNCWLVSAAMSIAERPERLREMFLIDEKNSANIYALKLYALGVPVTITVDDFVPLETYY